RPDRQDHQEEEPERLPDDHPRTALPDHALDQAGDGARPEEIGHEQGERAHALPPLPPRCPPPGGAGPGSGGRFPAPCPPGTPGAAVQDLGSMTCRMRRTFRSPLMLVRKIPMASPSGIVRSISPWRGLRGSSLANSILSARSALKPFPTWPMKK